MNFRIWYYLCLLLLAYNVMILLDESKLVSFVEEKANCTNKDLISFCISIRKLISNNKFNKNEVLTPKQLIDRLKAELFDDKMDDNLDLKSSYIHHDHICIQFTVGSFHQVFPNLSNYKFKLFYTPNDTQLYFFNSVFTIYEPISDRNFVLEVIVNDVIYLESPFVTNCTRTHMFLNEKNDNYDKVKCLHNCYKLNSSSSFFFYRYDENVKLNLKTNELVINEQCQRLCEPEDCNAKLFYRHFKSSLLDNGTDQKPKIELKKTMIFAIPLVNSFQLIIQIIGLVTLILNISLFEILQISIKLLRRRFPQLKALFAYSTALAVLVCIALFAGFSFRQINKYFNHDFTIRSYLLASKKYSPFTVYICLPVQLAYTKGDTLRSESELIFQNKTFLQIESDTNRTFSNFVKKSHLKKGGRTYSYKVKIENDVIFRGEKYQIENDEIQLLSRCMRIDMNITESKFESDLAFTQLILELNYTEYKIYYANYTSHLHTKHVSLGRRTRVYMKIDKNLPPPYRSNCLDYKKTYSQCKDRFDCVDNCTNRFFYENYTSITTGSVIYKFDFNESVRSRARFNKSEDNAIKEYCASLHPYKDCEISAFSMKFEHIEFQQQPNAIPENKLFFEIYLYKEVNYETAVINEIILLLDLINFTTIFFGINGQKVMKLIIDIIKSRRSPRIEHLRNFFGLLLISSCLTGFFAHSFVIIIELLTSELSTTQNFERITEFNFPDFMICFEVDLSMRDVYRRPTGDYLEELTSNMTFENMFDKIAILNEKMEEVNVPSGQLKSIESKINTSVSFIYDLKCFHFVTRITYPPHKLLKFENLFFVKLYFNETVYRAECNCLRIYIAFYEREKGTFESLQTYFLRKNGDLTMKSFFLIQPVVTEYDYTDRFYYIKNPLALFRVESYVNDDRLYYKKMLENFRTITNRSSIIRSLKKEKDEFSWEIDDQLLEQYYLQIQMNVDNSPYINPDYNVEVYDLNTLTFYSTVDQPEIIIKPTIFKCKIITTNDSNYIKLLINILNSLSFWLSISVMDLHIYIAKGYRSLKRIYFLLCKFQKRLRPSRFV